MKHLLQSVLVCAMVVVFSRTTADPDLWGHVRFGQEMVSSGTIRLADDHSFTSDRPWINHEWLAEVVMAIAYNTAGALGLDLLRFGIIILVMALVWCRLSVVGMRTTRLTLMAITGFGILLRVYPIRPQLFSVLLFAVLLHVIVRVDEQRSDWRALFVVPVVFALWVNLHGGWLVGFGIFLLWSSARLALRHGSFADSPILLALIVVSCGATLINPYGFALWQFLRATVAFGRPLVSDWQPTYTLPPALWFSWALSCGLTLLALIRRRGRIDPVHIAIVALLGVASMRVSRLDAFFALAAVYFLAPALVAEASVRASSAEREPNEWRRAAMLPAAMTVAALIVVLRPAPLVEVRDPIVPEPEAVQYAHANHLQGRMLTWFDWGEYAIWHLGPDIRVSIDGRRETLYSDARLADHLQFYQGASGAARYPDAIDADFVWLPKSVPAIGRLQADGWRVAFDGPASTILARKERDLPEQIVTLTAGPREFPGP